MLSLPELNYADKTVFYEDLLLAARGLVHGERDLIANCANLSALVFQSLPEINWAGFYFLKEGELVVGPFQGKPACVRIAIGEGVCGTAVKEGRTLRVDDVDAFPGHIACDADSRSEIVVPVRMAGEIVGVLDIDAPVPARFGEEDRIGLEALVSVLE
ncbi:GAF domain-containing protein [Natronospira bacteriovora]|uniref:GAF domain-containing protein n=1 Tax=Natronospira bacteriovora TaxID=3069753 RepID=A0ABU0W4G5_9GAMM|nr:GAF domain-containing protein [Natronospira sp. AB-CW4]MDQ2068913.1 GAF domain-containing protein [Natronospira sp. AB-CW4]